MYITRNIHIGSNELLRNSVYLDVCHTLTITIMATIFRQLYVPLQKTLRPRNGHLQIVPKRTMVYNKSGSIVSKPKTKPLYFCVVVGVLIPSVYWGGTLAQRIVKFLDDFEIHADDDED